MTVKSAARVIDVLDRLRNHPTGMTLQELCNDLHIPKSSMYELLCTMTERNYLIQLENKKYYLGFKLIELGLTSLERVNVYQISKEYMAKLVNLVEETVFMAVCLDDEIVYVNKMDCSRSIRTNVILGDRKPMHCTALGKSFLSYMTHDEISNILDRKGMLAFTPNTITDPNVLLSELEYILKDGIAYDNQEIELGLSCIASPIFDHNQIVVAAISVAGPTGRIEQRKLQLGAMLRENALQISFQLGYRSS